MREHDLGLSHDLPVLLSRRRALGVIAASVGAVTLAACGYASQVASWTGSVEDGIALELNVGV